MVVALENVTKHFPRPEASVVALAGISLGVAAGEFVAVRGPSGCGKTTLLLAAGGLLRPTDGRVLFAGRELYGLSPNARAHLRAESIGFVFQQFHLVPYLTVLENVLVPSMARPDSGSIDRATALIERFGLAGRARHKPEALSTGERQRTALARAMLHRPALLLADEPTGNLDEANGEAVLECLAEYATNGGAVLLATHDPRVGRHAHRVVHMADGRLLP